MQWALYSKSLQLKDYLAVLQLSEKADDSHDWQNKAIQLLNKQLQKKSRARWDTSITDKLLELYLHHKAFEEALTLVTKEHATPTLLLQLAWNISDQPEKAFQLFQRVIESKINRANNDAYHQAITILQEMADKLKTSQQKKMIIELLDHLRQNFRAKRNFIKWLNEAFE